MGWFTSPCGGPTMALCCSSYGFFPGMWFWEGSRLKRNSWLAIGTCRDQTYIPFASSWTLLDLRTAKIKLAECRRWTPLPCRFICIEKNFACNTLEVSPMFDAPLRLPGRQAIALTSFACFSEQVITRAWSLETGSQSVDSQLGVQGNTYNIDLQRCPTRDHNVDFLSMTHRISSNICWDIFTVAVNLCN